MMDQCIVTLFLLSLFFFQKGEDFSFVVKDANYLYSSTLTNFRNYINANPPNAPFDHGMFISG